MSSTSRFAPHLHNGSKLRQWRIIINKNLFHAKWFNVCGHKNSFMHHHRSRPPCPSLSHTYTVPGCLLRSRFDIALHFPSRIAKSVLLNSYTHKVTARSQCGINRMKNNKTNDDASKLASASAYTQKRAFECTMCIPFSDVKCLARIRRHRASHLILGEEKMRIKSKKNLYHHSSLIKFNSHLLFCFLSLSLSFSRSVQWLYLSNSRTSRRLLVHIIHKKRFLIS